MQRLPRLSLRSSTVARAAGVALLALMAAGRTGADEPPAPPPQCAVHLVVELTADVPNPRDSGFVSSLLGVKTGVRTARYEYSDRETKAKLVRGPIRDARARYLSRRTTDRTG